jgi:hypothetical protein
MSCLQLYLLGSSYVELDGQVVEIPRRKLWALLVYMGR